MKDNKLKHEVFSHYEEWTQDNEKRMTRKNGWNDITDAYYGILPQDWPYDTRLVDPRIRTSLIEKNARLLNSKLRGRLTPRESSDYVTAAIQNSILDYQWDNAQDGGSMLLKLGISDLDARMYQSKFALVLWKYETDEDGKVIFDGNEMQPLDIRDCGMDQAATHIKNAKWFQHRSWEYFEDIEKMANAPKSGFKNLERLQNAMKEVMESKNKKHSTLRSNEYVSRVRQHQGLEDRVGRDQAFPIVNITTEYRRDKWITFAPDYDVIIREIDNPYDHKKIPIAQLRYYSQQDDPLGESEVEPVIGLWTAIQANLCGYMDESILKMRPPLKVIENAARVETIQYGPETQWLVDRQDAIEEMRSSKDSLQYFQTTQQALVSAFNIAMGDISQGVSSVDPFASDPKTATEIKQTAKQQNVRDQKNQNDLSEFIKDIMMMWLSNNKQFLFDDPDKVEHIIKIVGKEKFDIFKRAGFDDTEVSPEAMEMIADIIKEQPDMTDDEVAQLYESAAIPKHPIITNPNEKNPAKLKVKPKMIISEVGDVAELSITKEDMDGVFDYIPDVKSMASGAGEEMAQARQGAVTLLTTNPTVLQLLQAEGYRPNVKELLGDIFEDTGLRDADRYFTKISDDQLQAQQAGLTQGGISQEAAQPLPGATPPIQGQGLPSIPQATSTGGL